MSWTVEAPLPLPVKQQLITPRDQQIMQYQLEAAYRVLLLKAVAVGPHRQVAVQSGHCADRATEV